MEGLSVDRVAELADDLQKTLGERSSEAMELADELLKTLAERSLGLARELSENGGRPDYWAGVGSYWAEFLNHYTYQAVASVAGPLSDRAWLAEMIEKACSSAGLPRERRLLLADGVAPYASQVLDFVVPLGTRVLDTAALLLEGTPWWVLWLALLVSMPGPGVGGGFAWLAGRRRPDGGEEKENHTKPRGVGVLGILAVVLAGLAAALATICLYAPPAAYLQLTLPAQSALLAAALSVGMVAWIPIVVGAVSLPWQLRLPVAAVLPVGLAGHLLMPEAAFCAARSQQCRDLLPDDIRQAQRRRERNRELLAGPHELLAATVRVLARTKPRGAGASSRAAVLAVGSHELKEDLTDFAALGALSPQMIFVEPNAKHLPGLNRSLAMIAAAPKHTQIINAAACVADKKDAVLYTSETAATRDSLHKQHVARYSDMKEKKVKCMAVSSVLESANIAAKDIDVVILDAEGSDLNILAALLRLPNFVPLFMRFPCCFGREARGAAAELGRTVSGLAARGYDIHLDGGDVLAVHESVGDQLQGAAAGFRR